MKTKNLKSVMMVLVALFSLNANAYDDIQIDGIYYILDSEAKTAQVSNGVGGNRSRQSYSDEIIVIPSSIEYEGAVYTVTSIGNSAFQRCDGLTSVTIPNTVTSIGTLAFDGSSNLSTISIPNSVISIGESAFQETAWLNSQEDGPIYAGKVLCWYKGTMPESTSITIKEGTIGIGQRAFANRKDLISVTIPNSVKSIGNSAFFGCSGLTSVDIPNSVTEIGSYAFQKCIGLTSLTIPNSVISIGSSAFYGTAWYNNQEDGLIYLGKVLYAYKGIMPDNTNITIHEGTTEICDYAFSQCTGLTSVTIPNSVTSIGIRAFGNCTSLKSVNIPNNVTKIDEETFIYCSGLTSVNLPNSIISIGAGAFRGCTSLKSVTIPKSVTQIEPIDVAITPSGAFEGCENLTSVTILNSTIEVNNRTFYGCSGLASATIEITDLAAWCAKPLTFEVPASCTRYLTLNGNIIKDLVIPQSVTSISAGAFSNCNSLTSVKVEWNRPLAGGAASFPEDVKKNVPLYVPKGTAMMYMSAPGWSEFVNIVEYEDGEDAHYITIRMGDGGVLKQSVEVGQTYTYAVSADEGWEVNTLTFDGKDMTSLLLDGQFSTPVITSNSELNVVFKQIDTNVKAIPSMSEVKVYASNKNITITGAEENAPVSVYGINGAFVTSAVGNATFTLESGVYVVKVGEETFKVRL